MRTQRSQNLSKFFGKFVDYGVDNWFFTLLPRIISFFSIKILPLSDGIYFMKIEKKEKKLT